MPPATTWRFPRSFWTANGVELFERAAYYGTFISLALYLTRVVGFTDVQTGWIAGSFAAALYFAPSFAGAIADSIGVQALPDHRLHAAGPGLPHPGGRTHQAHGHRIADPHHAGRSLREAGHLGHGGAGVR
ncbi:MAG: hypothetical protein ABIO70_02305 [Pseudomonadota bacterium]